MNVFEQHREHVASLKALRLSKYQLIWNREHEIEAIEKLDKAELTRMEIGGAGSGGNAADVRMKLDHLIASKKADIRYAEKEIALLDDRIKTLEDTPPVVMASGGAGGDMPGSTGGGGPI